MVKAHSEFVSRVSEREPVSDERKTALLPGTVTAYFEPVAFLRLVVAQLSRALLRTAGHMKTLPGALVLGEHCGALQPTSSLMHAVSHYRVTL